MTNIPVVIYHSLGCRNSHRWGHLSHPVSTFRRQLAYLRKHKFSVINLDVLYRHLRNADPLPPKPVALTFDDGFLDNWCHMFPVLREFGVTATVFVSTDYIQPGDTPRPVLKPGANRSPLPDNEWLGYMNRTEIRAMSESGLVSIQSHGVTHTWYFCGGEIIDFHHPGDDYPWLDWNRDPASKPFWLAKKDEEPGAPWGTPVYRFDKSLRCRRFFPDPEPAERCVRLVEEEGAGSFFCRPGWREQLFREIEDCSSGEPFDSGGSEVVDSPVKSPDSATTGPPGTGRYVNGRFETDEERETRYLSELRESKRILEEIVDQPVDYIAWPGNGFNELSQELAINRAGYRATAATGNLPNRSGGRFDLFTRFYYGNPFRGLDDDYILYLQFIGFLNLQAGRKFYRPLASAASKARTLLNRTGFGGIPGKAAKG